MKGTLAFDLLFKVVNSDLDEVRKEPRADSESSIRAAKRRLNLTQQEGISDTREEELETRRKIARADCGALSIKMPPLAEGCKKL
jgi:hypothetical protein